MIHATKAAICVLRDGKPTLKSTEMGLGIHPNGGVSGRASCGDHLAAPLWWMPVFMSRHATQLLDGLAPHEGEREITVTCPRCALFMDAALRKGGR